MPKHDNTLLYYTEAGTGETIVLLHGILGSGRYWDDIANKLKSDYHMVMPDLLGFGNSPKPSKNDYSLESQSSYLLQTIESIGISKPIVLVGHSMGALIALNFATLYPQRIKKLVLISMPIYKNPGEAKINISNTAVASHFIYNGLAARLFCLTACQFKPFGKRLAARYFTKLPVRIAEDSVKHTWRSYSLSLKNIVENQSAIEQLSKVTIPTVMLFGDADGLSIERNRVTSALNKNVHVKVIHAGHQIPLEAPDEIIKSIISIT